MGHSTAPSTIEATLGALKEAIWKRRPILGEIMLKHGDQKLFSYANDFMDVNRAPTLDPFKHELVDVAAELIGKRLGADVGERVKKQLDKFSLVSTADHHSFIDHPFWVNANIISGLPFLDKPDPEVTSLIVLSFASVSLNNASGFPRGVLFHGGLGNSSNLIKLPILPDKLKMGIVHSCRAYTREDLDRAIGALRSKVGAGDITKERAEQVETLLEKNFGTKDALDSADLNEQITKVNYRLWPQCFHPADGQSPSPKTMLDLIYFEIETLVTELLYRRHLKEHSLIHRFLFDPKYRELTLKHFNGVPGGFSLEKNWGTYLFWAIDSHQHRVRLELDGNMLVSKTRPELNVEFTPEGIEQALREKRIYPAMLLCYVVVSLYYGMKCLGGFCQVHDLTVAKEAWGNLLREIGEKKEADALEPIQTKELGGDGMVLAYSRAPLGDLFPATGIDMILSPLDTSVEKYLDRSKTVTLMEMMNPMLPEMYTVLYSSYERDPAMLTTTPEQIIEETGLGEKLTKQNIASQK